jgi:hypothetical protein
MVTAVKLLSSKGKVDTDSGVPHLFQGEALSPSTTSRQNRQWEVISSPSQRQEMGGQILLYLPFASDICVDKTYYIQTNIGDVIWE